MYENIKYIICNIKYYLLMIISLIVVFILIFTSIFVYKTNNYLKDEMYNSIEYKISIKGGITDKFDYALSGVYSNSYSNLKREYKEIKEYFDNNSINYNPFILYSYMVNPGFAINEKQIYENEKIIHSDGSTTTNSSPIVLLLFGMDDNHYFDNNNIKLLKGRNIENDNEIIINDDIYLYEEEYGYIKAQIGDIISLPIITEARNKSDGRVKYEYGPIFDFEVVGIYKKRKPDIRQIEQKDIFLNSRFYVSKTACLNFFESYYDFSATIDNDSLKHPNIILNDAHKIYNDIESIRNDYEKFTKRFNNTIVNDEIDDRDRDILNNSNYNYNVVSTLENVERIIDPINTLQINILIFTFAALFISLIIIFFSISYITKANITNNSIMMAIGKTYSNILLENIFQNIIIGIFCLCISFTIYRLTISSIINMIFKDSLDIQNNLMRIVLGEIDIFSSYKEININYSSIDINPLVYIFIIIIFLIIIVLLTILIYSKLQPKNLKKALTME